MDEQTLFHFRINEPSEYWTLFRFRKNNLRINEPSE